MYWWDIQALKALLVAGPLPQPMAFRYVAAYSIVGAIAILPGMGANRWDVFLYFVTIASSLLGPLYCYRANGGARGERFLDRYFSLGWVAVLRLLPAMMALSITLGVVEGALGGADDGTTFSQALLTVLLLIVAYWRIGAHIRSVAQQTAATSEPTT